MQDRVKNLEINVATLTGRVNTHIDQVRDHRAEAKKENASQHREVMVGLSTLTGMVTDNAKELFAINKLDTDRQDRGTPAKGFPRFNGRAKKVVGWTALGSIGLYVLREMVEELSVWLQGQ